MGAVILHREESYRIIGACFEVYTDRTRKIQQPILPSFAGGFFVTFACMRPIRLAGDVIGHAGTGCGNVEENTR